MYNEKTKRTGNTATQQDQKEAQIEQAGVEYRESAGGFTLCGQPSRGCETPINPENRPGYTDNCPIWSRHGPLITPFCWLLKGERYCWWVGSDNAALPEPASTPTSRMHVEDPAQRGCVGRRQ